MKDGVSTRDAYQYAVTHIKEHQPDLEKHFVKNIGFAVRPNFFICFEDISLLMLRLDRNWIPWCRIHHFAKEQPSFEKKYGSQLKSWFYWSYWLLWPKVSQWLSTNVNKLNLISQIPQIRFKSRRHNQGWEWKIVASYGRNKITQRYTVFPYSRNWRGKNVKE